MPRKTKGEDIQKAPPPTKADLMERLREAELSYAKGNVRYFETHATLHRREVARLQGEVPYDREVMLALIAETEVARRLLEVAQDCYRYTLRYYSEAED